jgi:hypothetical protein
MTITVNGERRPRGGKDGAAGPGAPTEATSGQIQATLAAVADGISRRLALVFVVALAALILNLCSATWIIVALARALWR